MMPHDFFGSRSFTGLTLFAMAMIGMGCAMADEADPDGIELALAPQGLGGEGGGGGGGGQDLPNQGAGGDPGDPNHLRPLCYWDHAFQRTARDLGTAAIAGSTGVMPTMPYMPASNAAGYDGCREEVLEVLVECALLETQTVWDSGPDHQQYKGRIGLASHWRYQALSSDEQRWVTACMLQRLNKFGTKINILLEGNDPAIAPDIVSQSLYPVPESSMWGNMFNSTVPLNPTHNAFLQSPPAFAAHACNEHGSFTCGAAAMPYAVARVCDAGAQNCQVTAWDSCGVCAFGGAMCTSFANRIRSRLPDKEYFCGDYSEPTSWP